MPHAEIKRNVRRQSRFDVLSLRPFLEHFLHDFLHHFLIFIAVVIESVLSHPAPDQGFVFRGIQIHDQCSNNVLFRRDAPAMLLSP